MIRGLESASVEGTSTAVPFAVEKRSEKPLMGEDAMSEVEVTGRAVPCRVGIEDPGSFR